MTVKWLAGNRIEGTSADRTTGTAAIPAVAGGWKEVGRTTLGSAGDNIDITNLPDKRYYMYLLDRDTSGSTSARMTFNDDSGSNYSTRYASDGTEYTATNQSFVSQHTSASQNSFTCGYITNKSDREKLSASWIVGDGGSGAGNDPSRYEQFWKWTNTSSAINRMDIFNHLGGDFASGSELVVLGYDPDDTHTDNFWEELASSDWSSGSSFDSGTFTAKKYLWVQGYVDSATINYHPLITVGNTTLDTGSNYAFRRSYDGNTDATATSQSSWEIEMSGTASPKFFNLFIVNNASNEKLGIMHAVAQLTAGAGTAPSRRETVCKWANTSNQINIIGLKTTTGDFASGSFIKVWGSN